MVPSEGDPWITKASEGAADLLGYSSSEELTQEKITSLVPGGETELVAHICEELAKGQGWDGRLRFLTKTEDEILVDISAEAGEMNQTGIETRWQLRNVTRQAEVEAALREREARLRALNEYLPLVMWTCDTHLRFTWMWGSGLEKLGLEENELVGSTLQEFLHGEPGLEVAVGSHLEALKGRSVSYEIEYRGLRLRCWLEPQTGPAAEIIGVVGTSLGEAHPPELARETLTLGHKLGAPHIPTGGASSDDEVIEVGPLIIDIGLHEVRCDDKVIDLTPIEFKLLVELARRPGRVLTREVLLDRVWGQDFLGGGSLITMAIKRLRSKIEPDPARPRWIETVRGVGYRMHRDGVS